MVRGREKRTIVWLHSVAIKAASFVGTSVCQETPYATGSSLFLPTGAKCPLAPQHHLEAILSLQSHRTVANDYTVRFENAVYQLLPPAWPGLRGGKVLIEKRADGSLKMRFRQRYLPFKPLENGKAPVRLQESLGGSAPQTPRSLSLPCLPAEEKGCTTLREMPPSAVKATARGSGRTPALPYPPDGAADLPPKPAWRPPSDHPWRKPFRRKKRTFLSG